MVEVVVAVGGCMQLATMLVVVLVAAVVCAVVRNRVDEVGAANVVFMGVCDSCVRGGRAGVCRGSVVGRATSEFAITCARVMTCVVPGGGG